MHFRLLILMAVILTAVGCSSTPTKEDRTPAAEAQPDPTQVQIGELKNQVSALNAKIEKLEIKLSSTNDKLDEARTELKTSLAGHQKTSASGVSTTGVSSLPTEAIGTQVEAPTSVNDPEAGFQNDTPVQDFRKAMVLYRAKKYPESIMAFSQFVEQYPDHPMAGAAEFYVAESYFQQNEFKLAIPEYKRVMTSYDRSSHVPDALKRLATAEEKLKNTESSAKYKQLLSSLFPQSPAAKLDPINPEPLEAAPAAPPKTIEAKTQPQTEAQTSSPAVEKKLDTSTPTLAPALDEAPPTAPLPKSGT